MKIIFLSNGEGNLRNFIDVRGNKLSLFELNFKLESADCGNIIDINNKTNKMFKSANELLKSIK